MDKIIINLPAINKKYIINNDKKIEFKIKDKVLIEVGQIVELGEVAESVSESSEAIDIESSEAKLVRKLTKDDEQTIYNQKKEAQSYISDCKEIISKYDIAMKLVDADLSFDGKKLTFYFSAEGRVDFRSLVTDLIKKYKKMIRLQQIGPRDEGRIIGGYGKCGRKVCCQSFLNKIDSVTLDMAKDQNLSTSAGKISGACGKLMCCLNYELNDYHKLRENLPKIGEIIKTKYGKGKVIDQYVLKSAVIVELENGERKEVEIWSTSQ